MGDWSNRVPAFLANKSGDQSITHDTATNLTSWTETYDPTNAWDNENSRFVVPSIGLYRFLFYCDFSTADTTGRRSMFVYNNSSSTILATTTIGNFGNLVSSRAAYDRGPFLRACVDALLYMTSTEVGQFIVPRVHQNNNGGTALSVIGSSNTYFGGFKLS